MIDETDSDDLLTALIHAEHLLRELRADDLDDAESIWTMDCVRSAIARAGGEVL